MSAKKVRQALEKKFDEDLTDRKKEIDDLIQEVLNEKGSGGEEEEEEEEEKPAPKKRKSAPKKDASDSEEEPSEDDDDEEEYAPKKKRGAPKKRAKKSDSDEEDWRAPKKTVRKRYVTCLLFAFLRTSTVVSHGTAKSSSSICSQMHKL